MRRFLCRSGWLALIAVSCWLMFACFGDSPPEVYASRDGVVVVHDEGEDSSVGYSPEVPELPGGGDEVGLPTEPVGVPLGPVIDCQLNPDLFTFPEEEPRICVPGSIRYCDTPTYCAWGEQICNDRGDGWGACYETTPPVGCAGYYYDPSCCAEVGACCQDFYDSDRDGDTNDSLGNCSGE